MAEKTTWILVCDASRARLFAEPAPGKPLALLESFEHPEGRAHVNDLVSDANGRKPVGGSRGAGVLSSNSRANGGGVTMNGRPGGFHGRPGAEPDTDPKDVEAQKFARSLAGTLEKGIDAHRYEALVITAPPRFLGQLRESISEKVRRRIAQTIDKDLSLLPSRDIEERVHRERLA